MTADSSKPSKITEEDLAALDAALEADEKRGPEAFRWADDLPEAPPLDSEHTTAILIDKSRPQS